MTGLYFVDRKPAPVNTRYHSFELEKSIWNYCSVATGLDYLSKQEAKISEE